MDNNLGLSAQELRAWRTVLRMRRALDRELDAHLASRGTLTESDYEVLRALYEAPGRRLRAGGLAAVIEWEPSRVSHKLKQMVARGLVSRRSSNKDLRGTVAELTDAGASAYEQVREEHASWTKANFIDLFSPAELEQLREFAERVLNRMELAKRSASDADPIDI